MNFLSKEVAKEVASGLVIRAIQAKFVSDGGGKLVALAVCAGGMNVLEEDLPVLKVE